MHVVVVAVHIQPRGRVEVAAIRTRVTICVHGGRDLREEREDSQEDSRG